VCLFFPKAYFPHIVLLTPVVICAKLYFMRYEKQSYVPIEVDWKHVFLNRYTKVNGLGFYLS
jgi:hypothetical protein